MKLQTQRWIDRWVGQLLCAAVSGWARFSQRGRPAPVLAAAPRHLLVILLSEMGSVVLAGPLFAALRQRYPGVTLHVLQLKKNQEVAALLGLARPEHLHALDDSSALTLLGDIWRVCRTLRALPLDAVPQEEPTPCADPLPFTACRRARQRARAPPRPRPR